MTYIENEKQARFHAAEVINTLYHGQIPKYEVEKITKKNGKWKISIKNAEVNGMRYFKFNETRDFEILLDEKTGELLKFVRT